MAILGCSACAGAPQRPATADAVAERADWAFAQGEAAAERGDTVRAEQYFTLALDRGHDARQVLPALLGVCLKSSRLRAALNYAEPYLQNHPDDHELRYLVASIHAGLGAADQARTELERLLRDAPGHADGHFLLAILELDAAPERTKAHFKSYLALEPSGAHAADVRERLRELGLREEAHAKTTPPSKVRAALHERHEQP